MIRINGIRTNTTSDLFVIISGIALPLVSQLRQVLPIVLSFCFLFSLFLFSMMGTFMIEINLPFLFVCFCLDCEKDDWVTRKLLNKSLCIAFFMRLI